MREKITNWTQEIIKLTEYSKTQPHAAYAIFCRGALHKYTYFMRTIQDIDEHLKPLDDINNNFLPTLLDSIVTDNERSLFQLPVRLGGLGMPIVSEVPSEHFGSSKKITVSLVTIILLQGDTLPDDDPLLKAGKSPSEVASFRPISLTSCVVKLLERIIADRLYYIAETNNMFSRFQAGFRKGWSCEDQITRIVQAIEDGFQHARCNAPF